MVPKPLELHISTKLKAMLGKLNAMQIEDFLTRQVTGRIGCHANGTTYIVPVNYVYKSPNILAHSALGKKIKMMRKNPKVCFEVDEIKNIFEWKSVIAWGKFEEVTNEDEKQQIMQCLIHKIMPLVNTPTGHPHHAIAENEAAINEFVDLIVYKITLSEKTGRFETELE